MTILPRHRFAIIVFVEKCYLTLIIVIAISELITVMSDRSYILQLNSDPARHRASISLVVRASELELAG